MTEQSSAAKHMFFYLLVLFTLSFCAIGVGQILFQVINAVFVETTFQYDSAFSAELLRMGISFTLIAGPIYWLTTHIINRELFREHLNKDSAVRKWLTYLFLLISSFVVVGTLINLLNGFLGGELTVKFLLKSLVVFVIAGLIFGYYAYDIRRENFKDNAVTVSFRVALGVLVLGSLVLGFFYLPSPFLVRSLREDEERLSRLRNISYTLENYFNEKGTLPKDFAVLSDRLLSSDTLDPVSFQPFEYRVVKGLNSYELCATFSNSNKDTGDTSKVGYRGPYGVDGLWLHESGKSCFQKTIQKVKIPEKISS